MLGSLLSGHFFAMGLPISPSFSLLFLSFAHYKILICKFCFRVPNSILVLCYGLNVNLVKYIVRFDTEDIFMLIRTGIVGRLSLELSH